MASLQCHKPVEQTCNQGQYYDSTLGAWVNKTHATQPSLVNTQTQSATKTQSYYPDNGLVESHTYYGQTQTTNPNTGYGSHGTTKTQAYYPDNGLGLTTNSHSHTNYVEQTEAHGYESRSTTVFVDQNKVHGHGLGHSHSLGSHGSRRGEHKKRGLFQKLKDGLTGGDSSCSSSDGESDDEHSGRRRPSHF